MNGCLHIDREAQVPQKSVELHPCVSKIGQAHLSVYPSVTTLPHTRNLFAIKNRFKCRFGVHILNKVDISIQTTFPLL